LHIVERKRWVSPYLESYLGLVDDDPYCVLEYDPLLCHLITRVEEFIQINVVALERLATFLCQGVKGYIRWCRSFPSSCLMCVEQSSPQRSHQNVLPYESNWNRKLLLEATKTGLSSFRTGWSGFVRTDDSQEHHQALMRGFSCSQVTSGQWRVKNHDNSRSWGGGY
jgi:hypothetical protein